MIDYILKFLKDDVQTFNVQVILLVLLFFLRIFKFYFEELKNKTKVPSILSYLTQITILAIAFGHYIFTENDKLQWSLMILPFVLLLPKNMKWYDRQMNKLIDRL